VIIGLVQLRTGGGVRVPYVAAGVGAVVTGDDHPEGAYFTLDTVPHETFAQTAGRVEEHIREYPDVMVIGLDADALTDDDESEREAMATLMTLAEHAENATTIPVILSLTPSEAPTGALAERTERIHEWWRRELCRGGEFRVCRSRAARERCACREGGGEERRGARSRGARPLACVDSGRVALSRVFVSGMLCLAALLPAGGSPTAAPVQAPPDDGSGLWGVGIGAWPSEARRRGFAFPPDLEEVRHLGANHVLVPITVEQETLDSSTVGPGAETLSDADLVALIRTAHRARLRVTLMPLIEVREGERDHWRGVLKPADPERWWSTYEEVIDHYAEIASREDVSSFVVGSELSSLAGEEHSPRWRRITGVAKARFDGALAWVSNHDALDRRGPLPFVDIAGVSAYFPLADGPDDSEAELSEAFGSAVAALSRYRREVRLPLVLFEVGFPSVDGGAMAPWDYTSGAPIDLEEQRAAYEAVARALAEAPFVEGALFWGWFGPGGPHDRYYTPRGKPAEAELARLMRARRGLSLASAR